jgi:hypothetical protein
MNIIYKHVNDLIPYTNNPRINDKAVDGVASSIKNYGFKVPIIIDSKNEIIAGHTRLKAAKKLALTHVPCIIADDLTDKQIKAYRIADNRVSEAAEWDNNILKIELNGLDEFTGFNEQDLEEIFFEDIAYKEQEEKNKPTELKIKFEKAEHVKKMEKELKEIFNKYEKIKVQIYSGEV